MSGIDEIKKKTKVSMDEMYDSKLTEQVKSYEVKKDVNNNFNHATFPEPLQTDDEKNTNISHQADSYMEIHKAGNVDNHPSRLMGNHASDELMIGESTQIVAKPIAKQQSTKTPSYKMTFNLSEESYKAFNDLYAKRMLLGRKTEKSEMISEAIYLLVNAEPPLVI